MLGSWTEELTMRSIMIVAALVAALLTSCARDQVPPGITHVVQVNERLSDIAKHYGISLGSLIRANEVTSRSLRPGQRLLIPGVTKAPPKAEPEPRLDPRLYRSRSTWSESAIDFNHIDAMAIGRFHRFDENGGKSQCFQRIHAAGNDVRRALDGFVPIVHQLLSG